MTAEEAEEMEHNGASMDEVSIEQSDSQGEFEEEEEGDFEADEGESMEEEQEQPVEVAMATPVSTSIQQPNDADISASTIGKVLHSSASTCDGRWTSTILGGYQRTRYAINSSTSNPVGPCTTYTCYSRFAWSPKSTYRSTRRGR
jgi:hypothetical protein